LIFLICQPSSMTLRKRRRSEETYGTVNHHIVPMSSIHIHPIFEEIENNRPSPAIHNWTEDAIKSWLVAHPIVCIRSSEKDNDYLAIENVDSLRICKSGLPEHATIQINLVSDDDIYYFLVNETIVTPTIFYRTHQEIGVSFKAVKKSPINNVLPSFGSCFSAQNKLARCLNVSKSTMFYSTRKINGYQNDDANSKTGDLLPIERIIKSRRK